MEELFGILFFLETVSNIINKIISKKGRIISYIKSIISVSISVQIVIIPIMMYYYKTISFTFLISNILSRFSHKYNNSLRFYNNNNIFSIYRN